MHEAQARGQHGLQADRAGFGLGERQALGLDVLRIMVGDDDVEQAGGERGDQALAIGLAAQRRRELAEGAVGADVVLVQRQMIDRRRRRDVELRIAWRARARRASRRR